jgi:hypothetical protein
MAGTVDMVDMAGTGMVDMAGMVTMAGMVDMAGTAADAPGPA